MTRPRGVMFICVICEVFNEKRNFSSWRIQPMFSMIRSSVNNAVQTCVKFCIFFYLLVKYTYYTPDRHQVLARDPSTTPFDLTSTIDFTIVLKLMLILTRTERTQLEPKADPPGKLMKCHMSFPYHSMWYHNLLTRNKRTHLVPQAYLTRKMWSASCRPSSQSSLVISQNTHQECMQLQTRQLGKSVTFVA